MGIKWAGVVARGESRYQAYINLYNDPNILELLSTADDWLAGGLSKTMISD